MKYKDYSNIRVVVETDILDRDGIGVEIYLNDEILIEIFRNDRKNQNEVTLFKSSIELGVVEYAIAVFNEKIGLNKIDN